METDLVVPTLGESIREAVIARWVKQIGESVVLDEPIVSLETEKVSVELPAPVSGELVEQRFPEGTTVAVGAVIGRIKGGEAASETKGGEEAALRGGVEARGGEEAALRGGVAAEPERMPFSPPELAPPPRPAEAVRPGRPLSPAQRKALRAPSLYAPERLAREEVVPMSPLRKTIAERLVQAQRTAAVLTTFNEADLSLIFSIRERHQEEFQKKHGIKLGLMSFFVKASVAALGDYPGLNAEIRAGNIVFKRHYDLGIAVGTGRGLVVPVLRDADTLSCAEIEKAIADFARRAEDNRLALEDLQGGTFTITNGGVFGSMLSTPLLNFPQSGILGMHKVIRRPIVIGAEIVIRPMMYLALSYDHRIVDGREAVLFLRGVKERIENPERLWLAI